MTLKNKDGTPYRLVKPNPIMKTQEIWEEYKIHNMQWEGVKSADTNQFNPIASDFNVQETFLSALDNAKAEIKIVETKADTQPKKVEKVEKPKESNSLKDVTIEKTFIHCLPATLRTRKDTLYDDSYTTIQYSDPISFEGVILKQQDLFVEIWTDVDSINAGSILFPKQGYKRWWRVQNKIQKGGGWILSASPSDYQPSFDL